MRIKSSFILALAFALWFGAAAAYAEHIDERSEEISTLFCANYEDLVLKNGFLPGPHIVLNFITHPDKDNPAVVDLVNRGKTIFIGETGECNVRPRLLAAPGDKFYVEDPFACVKGRKDSAKFYLPPDQYIVLAVPRGGPGGSATLSSILDLVLIGEVEIDEFGFVRRKGRQKATNVTSLITCPKDTDTLLVDVAICDELLEAVGDGDLLCEAGEECTCVIDGIPPIEIDGVLTDDGLALMVFFDELELELGEICNYPDQLLFEQLQLDANETLLDFILRINNNGLRLLHTRWYPVSKLNKCIPQCDDGINNDSDKDTDYPDDAECVDSSDQSEFLSGDQ
jgi:hypothetical protein